MVDVRLLVCRERTAGLLQVTLTDEGEGAGLQFEQPGALHAERDEEIHPQTPPDKQVVHRRPVRQVQPQLHRRRKRKVRRVTNTEQGYQYRDPDSTPEHRQ